ncbi:MAG: hypothetical protein ACI97A_000881 [Planctomycetota bacterium]|jgi:hypothetical protein
MVGVVGVLLLTKLVDEIRIPVRPRFDHVRAVTAQESGCLSHGGSLFFLAPLQHRLE